MTPVPVASPISQQISMESGRGDSWVLYHSPWGQLGSCVGGGGLSVLVYSSTTNYNLSSLPWWGGS